GRHDAWVRRDLFKRLAWVTAMPAALVGVGRTRSARAQLPPAGGAGELPRRGRGVFVDRALAMRRAAESAGDQPYGAVVVMDGRLVAEAPSRVVGRRDPTAHAEMEAIREACARLGTRSLAGAELYGSSRACPMCEAAAYWAGIARMVYGSDGIDAGPPRLGSC
ncbi:MAG: nucleoside deaminase, partial [Candidatus Rokuibacteriota bacterium]